MMWIMGYNDGVESLNNIQDPLLNGNSKHRPVLMMPRLTTTVVQPRNNNNHASIHNHSAHHHYDRHLLALNHYPRLAMAEHHRREQLMSVALAQQQVVVSSRWNPTPEQLQTLEELYRRGTRTPSAEEIQQIAAQLRRYGKIEGKNVFYWFQNHKARERQKRRRRQLESFPSDEQVPQIYNAGTVDQENVEKKDFDSLTEANRTTPCDCEERQQNKNWPANPTTLEDDEETFSTTKAECNKSDHGWAQFDVDDAELLHQRRNATWQFSSSPSPTNLINPCSVAQTVPSTVVRSQQTHIMTSSKIQETAINSVFLEPCCDHHKEAQTLLQLFPLRSDDGEGCVREHHQEEEYGLSSASSTTTSFTIPSLNYYNNYQFFEFLPLKN